MYHPKRLFRLGPVLLACGLSSAAVGQVDRFKPEPLEYNSPEPERHHVPGLYASIDVDSDPPLPIQVLFTYNQPNGRYGSSTWKYTFCNTVDWLVDGRPTRLAPIKYSQMELPDRRIEFFSQPVTLEQLKALGKAKKIEYRICKDEHEISSEDIAGLLDLAERGEKFIAAQGAAQ